MIILFLNYLNEILLLYVSVWHINRTVDLIVSRIGPKWSNSNSAIGPIFDTMKSTEKLRKESFKVNRDGQDFLGIQLASVQASR